MKPLRFKQHGAVLPMFETWGAREGAYSFCISHDQMHERWSYSIKRDFLPGYVEGDPHTVVASFDEAKEKCEAFRARMKQ